MSFSASGLQNCPGSPPRLAAISIRPRHSSPSVNRQLAELAAWGVEDLQVEGLTIGSRPQGLSNGETTDHSIYEAVVVMSVGVGAALWNATEFDESMSRPYGEPFDLAPRFVDFDQSPPVVKAILVTHASGMVTFLKGDVRLLGS
jgi:hypothetical protein